jgi:hypothetical protein
MVISQKMDLVETFDSLDCYFSAPILFVKNTTTASDFELLRHNNNNNNNNSLIKQQHTQVTMSLYTNQPNRMNPYDVDDGDDSIPPASGLTLTSKPAAATFPASSGSGSGGGRTTFT